MDLWFCFYQPENKVNYFVLTQIPNPINTTVCDKTLQKFIMVFLYSKSLNAFFSMVLKIIIMLRFSCFIYVIKCFSFVDR